MGVVVMMMMMMVVALVQGDGTTNRLVDTEHGQFVP
jgi:hypothetical protein